MTDLLQKAIAEVEKLPEVEQEALAAWLLKVIEAREEKQKPLTIEDLGWTREDAQAVRAQFGVFTEDWDDPAMDVYNDL
jgi:hypothetical protein